MSLLGPDFGDFGCRATVISWCAVVRGTDLTLRLLPRVLRSGDQRLLVGALRPFAHPVVATTGPLVCVTVGCWAFVGVVVVGSVVVLVFVVVIVRSLVFVAR
jgi:hypothetical protein